VVEIAVRPPACTESGVEATLKARFGASAHVVPVPHGAGDAEILEQVARTTARLLPTWAQPGGILGVAWGTTTSAVARNMTARPVPGLTLVQLNGAANVRSFGSSYAGEILTRMAAAFDAPVLDFPVPAFFDYATTREALWRERSVQRVLSAQLNASMAVFSVGAFGGALRSHVYAGGYLDAADVAALENESVVGDVCTVFLRADGSYQDIALNQRASGPTPARLAVIPRRVCVVSGTHKAVGLLAALRAGTITDLIVDEPTATALATLLA
jgi:DNA-binding transcriptional regulator LsrR (DeoR family)